MGWDELADQVLEHTTEAFKKDTLYTQISDNSQYPLRGIFDAAGTRVNAGGSLEVISTSPMLTVKKSDLLAEPEKGDQIVIDEKSYSVVDYREDGQGGVSLILQKESAL